MPEKPIIFSGPMVRPIFEGRKTQTRRIVKFKADQYPIEDSFYALDTTDLEWWSYKSAPGSFGWSSVRCPYGPVGTVLWVRETLKRIPWSDGIDGISYAADGELCWDLTRPARWVWKNDTLPCIHMPRLAARIFLRVLNIRAERLQDISEEDARAEGVTPFPYNPEGDCWSDGKYKTAFQYLWNQIHGWEPNAWSLNPWVWVIEFEPIKEAKADALGR